MFNNQNEFYINCKNIINLKCEKITKGYVVVKVINNFYLQAKETILHLRNLNYGYSLPTNTSDVVSINISFVLKYLK